MAGSKGGITGVHIALIVFVMLTIILGTTTYLFFDDYRTADRAAQEAAKTRAAQEQAARVRAEEVARLKEVIGVTFEDVGSADNAAPTTVLGEVRRQMQAYGAPLDAGQKATLVTHLQQLRKLLDDSNVAQNRLNEQVTQKQNELLTMFQTKYEVSLKQSQDDARAREADLRDTQAKSNEQIDAEKGRVVALQEEYQKVLAERDDWERKYNEETQKLNVQNQRLREQAVALAKIIKERDRTSFDRPYGEIVWVASDSKAVWINLGSADSLKPGTTFSVYGKNVTGTGFGPEDVKAAIEVTSIEGPHRALARVTSDRLDRPVTTGDPIFTPLWKPNSSQYFAVVGLVDFDGDGKSDRNRLHELVRNAGGVILTEVDDKGERTGPTIDERVKFLIVGAIPDPTNVATEEERTAIKEMSGKRQIMIQEAEIQGVRVISLDDFRTWMGEVNRDRVWRPGEQSPYTLRAGASSATVDEVTGDRSSSGTTSGLFNTRGRRMNVQSGGQSNDLFRGGSKEGGY